MSGEFKRLNYFQGRFLSAEDMRAEQDYHAQKRRLHRSSLHTPGVVTQHLDGLQVTADPNDGTLLVAPGVAVDGRGRELYLAEPVTLDPSARDWEPPTTIYVVLARTEEEVEIRENPANPDFSGPAFVEESVQVTLVDEAPDVEEGVELARIRLQDGARVQNPADPTDPRPGEIDRTYVRVAGAHLPFSRPDPALPGLGPGQWRGGTTNVSPTEGFRPSTATDSFIDIEEVQVGDRHRLYVASVYPHDAGAIVTWFVQSELTDDGAVEYRLIIKNFGDQIVGVSWRVYRLA